MPQQTIPVVSLDAWARGTEQDRAEIIQTIGDALVDLGFFAVEDHGVDQAIIDRAYQMTDALFALPPESKERYNIAGGRGQRGFTSYGMEHAKDHDAPDLKEFWHVGRELAPEDPDYPTLRENVWPTEIAEFKSTMLQLYGALDRLGTTLLSAASVYVGEDPGFLPSLAHNGDTILRLIHYPPIPEDAHPSAIRAAAHEDINLITILCEATAGGLELLQRDGKWRPIHALHGQLVVDSGDMIQHVTNGLLRSTTHRVVNPDNSRDRRFSMPFFVHPRSDADLTPRQSCLGRTGGAARYEALTAGQFLQRRLEEIGLGGA